MLPSYLQDSWVSPDVPNEMAVALHDAVTGDEVVAVPGIVAAVFGFLTFRSRIRGVYFSIITQALALCAWHTFNRNAMNLGGTNGLSGFKRGLYVASAICLCLAFLHCRWIVRSPAGKVLVAIRDSETRVLFCGYSPAAFKLFVFTVSAVLAVIIPPSILMIVWGGVLSVSIGALYLAGILPGLLIAAAQMATVHVYAKI